MSDRPRKIIHVVGARPNFMKVAPVLRGIGHLGSVSQVLVHTGQHYDPNMSAVFFQQLGIPAPDVNLNVGSGTHAAQTGEIMVRLEGLWTDAPPDLVLVYGDVNSTVAAALVCAKACVPLAHVEAGLRSGDRTMPEEINRLVTDQLADLLFTPSEDGNRNLEREGVAPSKIHLVGNVMIDTLVRLLPEARMPDIPLATPYALVTLHRPSNVDQPESLVRIMAGLRQVSERLAVVFPIHPRTRARLSGLGLDGELGRMSMVDPVGYLEFLALQKNAAVVITDSGGIQEETTFLGVPCLTMRENTERPITCDVGTNLLIGTAGDRLAPEVDRILSGKGKRGSLPPLWDGHAGERIASVVEEWLGVSQ